jgi:hypothetical protein
MLLSPLNTAVTIKAEKMRQALNLLRQCERDGYGVIATMTVQFENHHLPDFMLHQIKTATKGIVAVIDTSDDSPLVGFRQCTT